MEPFAEDTLESDELFRELSTLLEAEMEAENGKDKGHDVLPTYDAASASASASASDAAFGELYSFLNDSLEDRQARALSGRGSRRKLNRKKQSAVAAMRGLPSAPSVTLLARLALPPVSAVCAAFSADFRGAAAISDAAMNVKEDACSSLPVPMFCRRVMVSTMTLGLTLGSDAPAMMTKMLAGAGSKGSSMRDRLEVLLASREARAAAEHIFGRPWAITHAEKNALRFSSKQERRVGTGPCTRNTRGVKRKEGQEGQEEGEQEEGEQDLDDSPAPDEQRVFANAVIIMIPDSIEANIKSCKVFTSGVLHITGCLSIDEGLRVAGAVGQVVRLAFGLPDTGPHPVEAVDVQMINTDFSLDISIDRRALEKVINSAPAPQPCSAMIPPTKHASIKLLVAGVNHGTVLVFTTGKIMMTGFKNWLDLRRAFDYTVDVITQNADEVRSEIKQQARVNLNTTRGRTNRNVGINSPIMRLLPACSITL